MYRKKNRQLQKENVTISLEELVPENHLLRIIDKAIDFNFIYDEVENLYSDKGRPGIDPVSLFKIVFIQYLFGIRSMRQTIKEIEVNVAYRWFIGYSAILLLNLCRIFQLLEKIMFAGLQRATFLRGYSKNTGGSAKVRLRGRECNFYRFNAHKSECQQAQK